MSDTSVRELVTVLHGLYSDKLPVGNMTVSEIRSRYGEQFDIDPESPARVDGVRVGEDAVVRPGQTLAFVNAAAEMGP
jgi:hypothetical protein